MYMTEKFVRKLKSLLLANVDSTYFTKGIKMKSSRLVIATPHSRNEILVDRLRKRLPYSAIITLTSREELLLDNLKEINPDVIFFPHWSRIIPKEIYENFQCVIFHMTDLPYGRGGSPLQNLIVRGHKQTMLSAIMCVAELDAGPIYRKTPLGLEGTAEEILQRASALMEDMIVDIITNNSTPTPQVGEIVEFRRRRPKDGNIDSLESIDQIYDYIRMLDGDGYPSAFLKSSHFQLDLTQAHWNGDCLEAKVRIRRKENE
jgi:methionyl-tRNA formyltransferase